MSAFRVLRQDDNGQVFEVALFVARDAADARLAELEALTHKQTYWIESATCILAMDVAYAGDEAFGAAIAFAPWTSATTLRTIDTELDGVLPYVPGAFFERELPSLLALVDRARTEGIVPDVLLVDGYVWLGPSKPGLGAHLHEQCGLPVVGVSKTSFREAPHEEILRGSSARPLYVTTAGIDVGEAANAVRSMHGAHRIPTLLAAADSACRALAEATRTA